MSHRASFQELAQPISIGALFPLLKQMQWSLEHGKAPRGSIDCSKFIVALREPLQARLTWQEIGASTVRVSQAEIEWLERLYTFRERAEVLGFLERHPFLVSLLLEAYGKVEDYFPHPQVFLEVVADPEAFDDYQLVASIATSLDPGEAVETFEQFYEDWWLDVLDRARGKLCIKVEGEILRGELMEPRPTPSSALARIRARQPQILRRALEVQQKYGDPIQNLAELLGNMPGSQEDWEALIDEPYY